MRVSVLVPACGHLTISELQEMADGDLPAGTLIVGFDGSNASLTLFMSRTGARTLMEGLDAALREHEPESKNEPSKN